MSRGDWAEAFELLVKRRRDGTLGPSELESLAEAAWWSGHPELRVDSLERAHAAYVEAGDRRKAAQVAIELFDEAFLRLSHSVAVGWLKRAERLLEGEPEGLEHGYLASATPLTPSSVATNSTRHSRTWSECWTSDGVSRTPSWRRWPSISRAEMLVRTGDLNRGLALIDESTIAVVADELGPQAAGNVYCSTISACRDLADWGRAAEVDPTSRPLHGSPQDHRLSRVSAGSIGRRSRPSAGNWLEAEQEAKAACKELEDFRILYAVGWAHYEMGEIRLRMGDLPAADEAVSTRLRVRSRPSTRIGACSSSPRETPRVPPSPSSEPSLRSNSPNI